MAARTPKKTMNQLSDSDLAMLEMARSAQSSLASLGILSEEPEVEKQFDNFIEITGMPSRGIYYNSPIFGQPLKVPDLLQIQTLDDTNVNQRFSEIFTRRLRGIPAGEILIADELFIALWLRANSFPGFHFPNLPFTCTSCQFESSMEQSNFNFNQIDFVIENYDKLLSELDGKDYSTIQLPISKQNITIFMRRRKHQAKVDFFIKKDYTAFNKEPDAETLELMMLAVILDMGIQDLSKAVDAIKEMNPMDFIYLIKQVNRLSLTSTPVVNYTCPACGESTPSRGYPFRPDIFLPINQ